MNNDSLSYLNDLELEFMQEVKGHGSLSPHLVGDNSNPETGDTYLGYDIHPENLEALYFEGIGVPRWESIKAESVARQEEIYRELHQQRMSEFPLIGRVSDTDQRVEFAPSEIPQLLEECARVLEGTTDPKAIRAVQKFSIAATKAAERGGGLLLIPG